MKEPAMTTALFRTFVRFSGLGGVMLLSVACGGGAAANAGGAKAPTAAPAANTQGVAATPGGQQFGVADAPTSGDAGANRPALSGKALSSYQAGMQAFQAGDLQGAQNQFV